MENCFYCEKKEKLNELMVEVCELDYSYVYLVRNQNFPGRCVVAYKDHKRELFELSDEELIGYTKEVSLVSQAIHNIFQADKMNYGIYGDGVPHVHYHIVPKKKDEYCWGAPFNLQGNDQYVNADELSKRANLIKAFIEEDQEMSLNSIRKVLKNE